MLIFYRITAKALALLPLPAALLCLPACQLEPPFIHQQFAELKPTRVTVPPVENRTLLDLNRISTAGALQRLTFGRGEVDVLEALGEGLREALVRKGYEVEAVEAPAAAAGASGGMLECAVTEFSAAPASSGGGIEIGGELSLIGHPPQQGEVLFQRKFWHSTRRSGGGLRTAAEVQGEIRRFGLGLLDALPPRVPEPAAAAAGAAR